MAVPAGAGQTIGVFRVTPRNIPVRNFAPAVDTTGTAGRLAVGWRDRVWDAAAMFRYCGDDFNPGMGFVRRRGIRHWYGTFGAHPRVPLPGVLEINPFAEVDYFTSLRGVCENLDGTLGLGVAFQDGGTLSLRYNDRRELLERPFQIRPGILAPVADYHTRDASASYQSSERRMISGNVGVSGGGYYTGNRFTISGGLSRQPDYHITLDASAQHNEVSLPDTSFTADLYAWRVKYAYSTTLYFGAFVQYNADADQVVTNLRFNWIHAPLSDFFLVLTERRDVSRGGRGVLERLVTAKVTKLFAC